METLIIALLIILIFSVIIIGTLILKDNTKNSLKKDYLENIVKKIKDPLNNRLNNESLRLDNYFNSLNKDFGELKSLSNSLSNLDKIFSNSKDKGNWGELNLESQLESILNKDRYETQKTINKNDKVDFVIKLRSAEKPYEDILLPIDCKNYTDKYSKITDILSEEEYNEKKLTSAKSEFEREIKKVAKDINKKYIHPPLTTDFAIMYIPSEAIFAEISNMDNLITTCQKEQKVIIAGPTSIAALVFSLRFIYSNYGVDKGKVKDTIEKIKKEYSDFSDIIKVTETHILNASSNVSKLKEKCEKIQETLDRLEDLDDEVLEIKEQKD